MPCRARPLLPLSRGRPYGFDKFCVLYDERGHNCHVTDEVALLRRAKAYDPQALGQLYDRYAPRMYAYIYRRVGDGSLAEELTGELFLRVLRAIRMEQAWGDSFTAWLYRIAHNLVVDHYRGQPPTPPVELDDAVAAPDQDPSAVVADALRRERLQAAMRLLTPDQQEVLALRFGEGMTAKEAAQVMEKTTGAIEALQHRALAALRRILNREES
jgi:RNA polymerase sigma-70 factor (ECF subfamily)